MISVENITKSFGDLQVLKGINLEVNKGEIVSVVGASGAGKTTLLQIIGTLMKKDTGRIVISGTDVDRMKEKQMARFRNQSIGFVFQFHHLLPEFTAFENVCIPGYIARRSRKEVEDSAEELLTFLGLTDRLDHKPSELSGGEQQRIAVARALINNPAIILADEPSGNLDSQNKKELHELFFTLRDKYNQTFMIVTHDKELAGMSDRMIQLKDGIVVQ
ncbi:MAG: lipoprotein ABC transporter ATP-binding protein [Bacteroides sp. SM23_62_1]|nr:MAG: lipoprotein ABC transporter ATP-binding protein [Bacteroides sp. SM23_62_1]